MTENKTENETANDEDDKDKDKNKKEIEEEEVKEYVSELTNRLQAKEQLRQSNKNCTRPQESHFSKLDSGLKKNTTFVKKLKVFSAQQLDSLLKDCSSLNLTKYVSEIAAAIVEAKLKMSDIPAAIKFCSVIHQSYVDFSQSFFENWQKNLTFKTSDKITNPSKLRVDLRFYAELVSCGIFSNKSGLSLLGSLLTVLINMDKEEHNNLSIILSFCKHCGDEYAGLIPKRIVTLATVCITFTAEL